MYIFTMYCCIDGVLDKLNQSYKMYHICVCVSMCICSWMDVFMHECIHVRSQKSQYVDEIMNSPRMIRPRWTPSGVQCFMGRVMTDGSTSLSHWSCAQTAA